MTTVEHVFDDVRAAKEAIYAIENLAALRAYNAKLGASEWDAFIPDNQRWALDYYRKLLAGAA